MTDVTFRDCQLIDVDFGGARLKGISFPGSQIESLDISKAECERVDFRRGTLGIRRGYESLRGTIIDTGQLVMLAPMLADQLGVSVLD